MQTPAPDDFPPRNYIRRKRCLNESFTIIEKTLQCIYSIRKEVVDKKEIEKQAKAHANEVEAACWAPRMRMSDDNYQSLMETKTKELCIVLIKKLLPNLDASVHSQQGQNSQKLPIPQVPQKPLNVKSIPQRAATPVQRVTPHPVMKQAKMVGLPPMPIINSTRKFVQNKLPTVITTPNIKETNDHIDPWAEYSIPLPDSMSSSFEFLPSFFEPSESIDDLYSMVDKQPSFADDNAFEVGNIDINL